MSEQVVFDSITKRYGETCIFEDFSFAAQKGEKVVLIGSSGSGKSTILRILMTLEEIQGGEVYVDGEPLWHEPGKPDKRASEAYLRQMRTRIGMVFQQFNLFPHMTALRNVIEAPLRVLKVPRKDAEARGRELLERVGLGDRMDNFPAQLSGGQQQRVAIARALAMRPEILLFDEPTSALDPEMVGEVQNVIRELAEESELTMLIVTHEMRFAREIADRVCFLDKGQIIEEGSPAEVMGNPKKERTQAFLQSLHGG
ncbi:ectoine/hydroxyectoine ABC transporter ATP-binding protein EhuA [Acidihalobacter ferrooxydans]|uniref:Ectoine/hydroxyectoine ABC transporter ATP-binding protein EhuA n=1 Tax=Acidihalobacter ferrooxydans TaxID=1765967 RepID=A0A1P8UG02_9GAMM|nr:ectoine/hydroxyectoine ABC transporter ATP-binding protein EhuA [Acidihalobacter ferrooxydans]APZ42787.1 ectoine/hydroxyectoine ABC transporter ATP-binding protein EhuA [Acidihalobacter ferrooxydans]